MQEPRGTAEQERAGGEVAAAGPQATTPADTQKTPLDVSPRAVRKGAPAWLAGLVGGIAGGAAVALVWMLVTRDQPPDPRLVARIGNVEQTLASAQARLEAAGSGLGSLQQRLDALAAGLARIDEQLQPLLGLARTTEEMGVGVQQLRDRLEELAKRLTNFAETIGRLPTLEQGARLDEAVQALRQEFQGLVARAGALERRLGEEQRNFMASLEEISRDLRTRTDAVAESLRQRLAALEQTIETLAVQPNALQELNARIETGLLELRERLAELRQTQAQLATRLTAVEQAQPALAEQLEALRASLVTLDRRTSAVEDSARVIAAALEERSAELSARLAATADQLRQASEARARDVAILLATAEISAAATAGGPYRHALDLLRQAAGDDPQLGAVAAALDRFADRGIPTPGELAARFAELAPAMLGEPEPPPDDLLARTERNLSRLLIVRRRGEPPAAAEAAIAAARERLARGDAEGAAAALAAVAESGNTAARDWLALVEARRLAVAHVQQLVTLARARLARDVANG